MIKKITTYGSFQQFFLLLLDQIECNVNVDMHVKIATNVYS